MKYQMIYGARYNATKQNVLWIKERLELEDNFQVELSNLEEAKVCDDSGVLILSTGIYSGEAVEGFYEFIEKNAQKISQKKVILVVTAMNKENCFDEENNLKIIKNFPQSVKDKIIFQEVLLGEMIFKTMTEEDKISIDYFYKKIMHLEGKALEKMLMPRTLLDKKDVWKVSERIIELKD